jgi:hypothetical protein
MCRARSDGVQAAVLLLRRPEIPPLPPISSRFCKIPGSRDLQNEGFLAECLAGGPFTRRETVIQNVFRLEGGACLTVDGTGLKHRPYYDLAAAKLLRFASYDDCANAQTSDRLETRHA